VCEAGGCVRHVTVRGEWVYEARGCHGEEQQQGSSRKEDGEEHGRGGAAGEEHQGGSTGGARDQPVCSTPR
jgi:hypothetical protein